MNIGRCVVDEGRGVQDGVLETEGVEQKGIFKFIFGKEPAEYRVLRCRRRLLSTGWCDGDGGG